MNTKLINKLLKRINKDVLKIKHELNNNNTKIITKKYIPPTVIECDDKPAEEYERPRRLC